MPMAWGIPMPGGGIPPGGIMPGGMSMGGIPAGPCDKMNKPGSDIYHHKLHVCRATCMTFCCLSAKSHMLDQLHQVSQAFFHSHIGSPLSYGAAYC